MPRLVAEEEHSRRRADAAAEKGDEKEGRFPDAPPAVPCAALINAHESKADNGHYGMDDEKDMKGFHPSGL